MPDAWIGARSARKMLKEELELDDRNLDGEMTRISGFEIPMLIEELLVFDQRDKNSILRFTVENFCYPDYNDTNATNAVMLAFSSIINQTDQASRSLNWNNNNFVFTIQNFEKGRVKNVALLVESVHIELIGLQFHLESLAYYYKFRSGGSQTGNNAGDVAKHKGKPGNRHGHAIAAATLRLNALSEEQLQRYTNASLGTELADDYRQVGAVPPTLANCEDYAGGILAVLRARYS